MNHETMIVDEIIGSNRIISDGTSSSDSTVDNGIIVENDSLIDEEFTIENDGLIDEGFLVENPTSNIDVRPSYILNQESLVGFADTFALYAPTIVTAGISIMTILIAVSLIPRILKRFGVRPL